MRILHFLFFFLLTGTGLAQTLDSLVASLIRNHPDLKSAQAEQEIARAKQLQSGAWETPKAGFEFFNAPVSGFPNPMKDQQELDYSLSQMIPFPGKLSAMKEAAGFSSDMMGYQLQVRQNQLIRELKKAWNDLVFADDLIRINEDAFQNLKRAAEITSRQYANGQSSLAAVLSLQTALSMKENDLAMSRSDRMMTEAMVNQLAGRPAELPIRPESSDIPHFADWTFTKLADLAEQNQPELKQMSAGIMMASAEKKAAEREYYPDFEIKGQYKQMLEMDKDYWSLMVGISIPLAPWSSGSVEGKVAEASARENQTRFNKESARQMIRSQVRQFLAKAESEHHHLMEFQEVISPQADFALESTLTAYQNGKAEFSMVMEAIRMQLEADSGYQSAKRAYLNAQTDLEWITATSMENW